MTFVPNLQVPVPPVAPAPAGTPRILDPQLLWTMGLLALSLVVLAILWVVADRWRRRMMSDSESAVDEMTSFRALYERGELSKEEYDRVRSRLAGKLRQELKIPPKPTQPVPGVTQPIQTQTPPMDGPIGLPSDGPTGQTSSD